jgi:Cft2 family RNA processing exonuclease/predicted  nucleic acid-binding Zn-ribbon protein
MAEDLEPRLGSAPEPANSGGLGDDSEVVGGAKPPSGEPAALPSDVLVEALTRRRRVKSLDGSSVPAWLMAEPIEVALEWLEIHGRRCQRPRQCSETPGPLRQLLKMRPAARKQHEQTVHAALWQYASVPMVEMVRSDVAARHADLVSEIGSGVLFEADRLRSELRELDRSRAQELGAALWSTGFELLRAKDLFRVLPVLFPDTPHAVKPTEPPDSPAPVSEPAQEKRRHRIKRQGLERKISELEAESSRTRDERRARGEQLARVKRELETATAELEASTHRIEELEQELQGSVERRRSSEALQRETERSRKQSFAASEAYRADLGSAQAELVEAEAERRGLVRRLASAHAQIQELEAQLRAIPRDKRAIADWLQREEARLRDLEYTLEGGTRARVAEEKRLRRKLELAFLEAYPEFKQERPPAIGGTRSLNFRALGGGNEVGRSAYLISIGSHDVLVDCGIAVGAQHQEDQLPDLSSLSRLDALLITHAHTDHIGWIPAVVAALDYFPIYCTRPTAELLPVMLRDSRGHYERAVAEDQLKRAFDPTAPPVVEAYSRDDIVDTETRLLEARVAEAKGVGSTDLIATFFPAGHILGAASIVLEGGGRRVVISGDVSSEYQHTVGPFKIVDGLTDVDLLVLESTYGDRPRPPMSLAEDELVSFVGDTVARGIALLPCFALGRAQEVLAILKSARRAGRLPADLKILVDGMINKINPIYVDHAKLESTDFIEIGSQLDRELVIQGAAGADSTPTVVVTTSGMLTGGPVIEWARRLLPYPRNRMALLGYQDECAPGGLLKKLARERPPYTVTLRDEAGEPFDVRVAAPVTQIGLSAHADQDGLVRYAAGVRARRIVLVHGDDAARSTLRERLIREGICQDVELGQTLHLP